MKNKNNTQHFNEFEVALLPVPNVIVLPKTSVSFFLHDERYMKTMDEVIENHGMVVLSMTDPVRDKAGDIVPQALLPRAIAVLALPSYLEENGVRVPHGLVMRGLCKVKITKIVRTFPALVCKVVPLEDDLSFMDCYQNPDFIDLKSNLTEWIDKNIDQPALIEELKESMISAENVVNHVCLLMIDDRETRQFLLETLSLYDRFEILTIFFDYKMRGVDFRPSDLKTLKTFFTKSPAMALTH